MSEQRYQAVSAVVTQADSSRVSIRARGVRDAGSVDIHGLARSEPEV